MATGPAWKPMKGDGNYGKAVSSAAKAKPKPATPLKKTKPKMNGGPSR